MFLCPAELLPFPPHHFSAGHKYGAITRHRTIDQETTATTIKVVRTVTYMPVCSGLYGEKAGSEHVSLSLSIPKFNKSDFTN